MTTITPAPTYPIRTGSDFDVVADNYSGTFIPTLWSARMNAKFYAATVFGEIANTDWEGEIKNQGDKVIINNIPSITIQDYEIGGDSPGANNSITYEVPAASTVEMQIDKGKYFAFKVNDILEYQAKPDLMSLFTDDAAEQMKVNIDAWVLYEEFNLGAAENKGATAGVKSGSFNLGTDAAPVALTGANILTYLTALSAVMDEQNIPESGRCLVIDPVTRQLLMESNLAQAQFMGDQTSMIRNGRIGMIDRFMVYVSNQLPVGDAGRTWKDPAGADAVDAGTAKRRAVIATHKTALSFASQMTKVERLQNPNDFGEFCRGLNVYGKKMVKPESWCLLTVAS